MQIVVIVDCNMLSMCCLLVSVWQVLEFSLFLWIHFFTVMVGQLFIFSCQQRTGWVTCIACSSFLY